MGACLKHGEVDLFPGAVNQTIASLDEKSQPSSQRRNPLVCRALDLFKDCDLNFDISQLHMGRHQTLFLEQDPADCFFEIIEGTACLYKIMEDGRRQIVKFAIPGSIIGLTVAEQHELSAEIVCSTTVLRIRPRAFRQRMESDPKIAERIMNYMHSELLEAHEQILTIGQKTSIEKVATFIWQMAGQCECRQGPLDHVPLQMTRSDIADFLGLTMETVSRTISYLQQVGMIANSSSSSIQIVDFRRLKELADGNAQ